MKQNINLFKICPRLLAYTSKHRSKTVFFVSSFGHSSDSSCSADTEYSCSGELRLDDNDIEVFIDLWHIRSAACGKHRQACSEPFKLRRQQERKALAMGLGSGKGLNAVLHLAMRSSDGMIGKLL